MGIFKRMIDDIRQRRNLDVYITIIIAILVTVLGIFQVVDQSILSSAILAVLALVTYSILLNRHENVDIQKTLAKIVVPAPHLSEIFQDRSHLRPLSVEFSEAQSIDIAGMSLLAISTSHYELLLKKAKTGCKIRLLLLDPNNEALMKATCGLVGSLTPNAHRQEIITSLNTLTSNPELFASGTVEIKLLGYPQAHGFLIINGEASDGHMRVEIYMRIHRPTHTPGFSIRKDTDLELFDTFLQEFNLMWGQAIPYYGEDQSAHD